MIDVQIDEESPVMLNIDKNEVMVITELAFRKGENSNLFSECQKLLQRIENVIFDVKGNSRYLLNLRKHLASYYKSSMTKQKKKKV